MPELSTNQPENFISPGYHAGQSTQTFFSSIPDIWDELSAQLLCATSSSVLKNHSKTDLIFKYKEPALCAYPTCPDIIITNTNKKKDAPLLKSSSLA